MVTSNYDLNVQLALATTALAEGDFTTAREFLAEARRLSRSTDRTDRARMFWHLATRQLRAAL